MDKDISFYYSNCMNLNIGEIKQFIELIVNEEIKRLGIKTNITISYVSNRDYAGALNPNFERDLIGNYIFPLRTKGYTLEINDSIIETYLKHKTSFLELKNGVKIPKSLDVLSAIVSLCSHEVRHAYQEEQVMYGNINNVETILWLKQMIVRNHHEAIYDINYETYFTEQDSINYQSKYSFELLDRYSNLPIEVLEQYKNYLKEKNIIPCKEKKLDVFYQSIDDNSKRKATAYIIELFNEIVGALPKEYIENSPLKYEYNSDGSKKNYLELIFENKYNLINGLNLSFLYDFIIECDYNLQTQKYAYLLSELDNLKISQELKEKYKEEYTKKLKLAYHTQTYIYDDMHKSIEECIRKLEKKISDISLDIALGKISQLEGSEIKYDYLKKIQYFRAIEKKILENIRDYKRQMMESKANKDRKNNLLNIIEEYKLSKNIYPIVESGTLIDKTDYNKLIAMVLKELHSSDIKSDRKEYLLKVKRAIQEIYFPKTLEINKKIK